jgi:hypothetical protein
VVFMQVPVFPARGSFTVMYRLTNSDFFEDLAPL